MDHFINHCLEFRLACRCISFSSNHLKPESLELESLATVLRSMKVSSSTDTNEKSLYASMQTNAREHGVFFFSLYSPIYHRVIVI